MTIAGVRAEGSVVPKAQAHVKHRTRGAWRLAPLPKEATASKQRRRTAFLSGPRVSSRPAQMQHPLPHPSSEPSDQGEPTNHPQHHHRCTACLLRSACEPRTCVATSAWRRTVCHAVGSISKNFQLPTHIGHREWNGAPCIWGRCAQPGRACRRDVDVPCPRSDGS